MVYIHDDYDDDDADGGLMRHHLHHGHALVSMLCDFYGEIEDWPQWYHPRLQGDYTGHGKTPSQF